MSEIETIETIYSPGTAKYLEDRHFIALPFLGVIDGCSAPYCGQAPLLFDGFTGGQMVGNVVLEIFNSAPPDSSLELLAKQANTEIGNRQKAMKIPLDNAGKLAGASFLLEKIHKSHIEIIQGGDCYAAWLKKSGEINITKNKTYEHELALVNNFARLMEKFNGNREKAWQEHFSFLAEMKKKNANITYAELNGQPEVENYWNKIEVPISDLLFLICFTDGLVPFSQMANEKDLAKDTVELFKIGRFERVFQCTRTIEKLESGHSHEDQAEATGLAITFK